MICPTCREAADDQRPADQHCGSTGGPGAACTCQHRVDRYHAAPCPCGGTSARHLPDCPIHPARLKVVAEAATKLILPPELRAAGLHFEYGTPITTTKD